MPLTTHSLFHTIDGLAALGTIILAVGTILLAWFSFRTARGTKALAVETRELASGTKQLAALTEKEVQAVIAQAEAATQQVDLSRSVLRANIRPCLIDVPLGLFAPSKFVRTGDPGNTLFRTTDDASTVIVSARNVGAGLALVQRVTMHWPEPGAALDPTSYAGRATTLVVPPGEFTQAIFFLGASELNRVQKLRELGYFWVQIDYLDASGEQAETTRLDLKLLITGDHWIINRVSLYHEGDPEPYVSSEHR